MALTDKLTVIADAIRAKTGGTSALTLDGMAEAVAGIEAGGGGFPNGTEWTQSNFAAEVGSNCQALLYSDDGNWFLTYKNSQVYCSSDGMTWTRKAIVSGITSTTRDGCYARGVYLLATDNGIWYSTDCVGWTQSNVTGAAYRVVYKCGVFVAYVLDSGIYYSTDGMTWTQSNVTSGQFNDVCCNDDGFWIACGSTSDSYWSEDGMTWTRMSTNYAATAVCGNGLWVLASIVYGLYYSTDGKTWNASNLKSGGFVNVSYADGMWVASGRSNGLWYSTDGMTWIQSNVTSCNTAKTCGNPALKRNGVWVAYVYRNGLYHSTDGMTWTESNYMSTSTNAEVKRIRHGNGVWVVCGDAVAAKYSPTWLPSN